jgi:hypothetical protein
VNWDEARILEIESNSRYRKYKESAHTACSTNPISEPSLEISPIWIPLSSKEVSKSKIRQAHRGLFQVVFIQDSISIIDGSSGRQAPYTGCISSYFYIGVLGWVFWVLFNVFIFISPLSSFIIYILLIFIVQFPVISS